MNNKKAGFPPILDKLLASPVVGLLNSAVSVVKDKTPDATDSVLHEKVKKGISVSSKRLLNLSGTSAIIGYGIVYLSTTPNPNYRFGCVLIAIGVVYSVAMSLITALGEKWKSNINDKKTS